MVGQHAAPPSAPSSVWVRRCRSCRADDLARAFGRPEIIDDGTWSCKACGTTAWMAVCRAFPSGEAGHGCPLGHGREP